MSATTVSNLNDKAFASVEAWRNRPIDRACPYVYVDGLYLERSWGGSYENVAVMVVIGVNDDGYREVIGAAKDFAESAECRRGGPVVAEVRGTAAWSTTARCGRGRCLAVDGGLGWPYDIGGGGPSRLSQSRHMRPGVLDISNFQIGPLFRSSGFSPMQKS